MKDQELTFAFFLFPHLYSLSILITVCYPRKKNAKNIQVLQFSFLLKLAMKKLTRGLRRCFFISKKDMEEF